MKTAGERERYALMVIIKEMKDLKEKLWNPSTPRNQNQSRDFLMSVVVAES